MITLLLHLHRFGYGLNYSKDFNEPGVSTCYSAQRCGCPTNLWGQDCSIDTCAKGCDFANEIKDLFFHGPDVIIDPRAGLDPNQLEAAATALSDHIKGNNVLSGAEITNQARKFIENAPLMTTTMPLMNAALDLVDNYETYNGPLFINSQTKVESIMRFFLDHR